MEEIHSFFKSKNVSVSTFYQPKTNWKDIVRASKDASCFLYRGHGMSWPDGKYGGLYDGIKIEVNKTSIRNQGMEQNPIVKTSDNVKNDWRNWKF